MEKTSPEEFFGFAFIADMRNFSEVCRRLLIAKDPEEDRVSELKKSIYAAFFESLVTILKRTVSNNKDLIFDYKHTGDGFLYITKSNLPKITQMTSFRFLLDLYLTLDKEIPQLNKRLSRILNDKNNQGTIKRSKHLKYIKTLFADPSTGKPRDYITFSIGAHCGNIYPQEFNDKILLLGNTINMAARLQELSKTFSDFNLFFSKSLLNLLKKYRAVDSPSIQNSKALGTINIRGIGGTQIYTIPKAKIPEVLKSLADR